jgi:hypothetical protein
MSRPSEALIVVSCSEIEEAREKKANPGWGSREIHKSVSGSSTEGKTGNVVYAKDVRVLVIIDYLELSAVGTGDDTAGLIAVPVHPHLVAGPNQTQAVAWRVLRDQLVTLDQQRIPVASEESKRRHVQSTHFAHGAVRRRHERTGQEARLDRSGTGILYVARTGLQTRGKRAHFLANIHE